MNTGILGERRQLCLDGGCGSPVEIIGRDRPKRDGRNAQLAAPLQHIVELPRAKRINLMGISRPVLTSISTIAVENYADVPRRRLDANLMLKPDFV